MHQTGARIRLAELTLNDTALFMADTVPTYEFLIFTTLLPECAAIGAIEQSSSLLCSSLCPGYIAASCHLKPCSLSNTALACCR